MLSLKASDERKLLEKDVKPQVSYEEIGGLMEPCGKISTIGICPENGQ